MTPAPSSASEAGSGTGEGVGRTPWNVMAVGSALLKHPPMPSVKLQLVPPVVAVVTVKVSVLFEQFCIQPPN